MLAWRMKPGSWLIASASSVRWRPIVRRAELALETRPVRLSRMAVGAWSGERFLTRDQLRALGPPPATFELQCQCGLRELTAIEFRRWRDQLPS